MIETVYTLQIAAGMAIDIEIPVDDEGKGFFPNAGPIKFEGSDKSLINGFFVENIKVGTIKDAGGDELSITYTHIESTENKIHFYASTNERCVIMIVNTPIHDHSSMVQGGPAFGTYFSEDNVT